MILIKLLAGIVNFRPWNSATWPSISTLLLILPLGHILNQYNEYVSKRFSTNWLQAKFISTGLEVCSNSKFSSFILTLLVIKLIIIIREKRHNYGLFERGNVPSVPRKNLLSGNLFEMIVPFKNLIVMEKYHKLLGKTYGMFYGPDPWLLTTDLELLHKVFILEGTKNIDRNQFRLPFINEINLSLVAVQGDHWRNTRRIMGPAFSHKTMQSDNVIKDIEVAVDKLMECLDKHPMEKGKDSVGNSTSSRIIDLGMNFKKFTVEVIFKVAFGMDNGVNWTPGENDKLVEITHEGSKYVRGPIVWTSIMLEGTQRLLGVLAGLTPIGKYMRYIHWVLDQGLWDRQKRYKQSKSQMSTTIEKKLVGPERRMIDSIIESCSTNKMSDEELRANLFFVFVAGFETSANTLTILFWFLAHHQEKQDKLREALSVEGDKADYLDWCIKETLRLYPAVPSGVGRIINDDMEHDGMKLFAGTAITASVYSIHHSKEYWGPDAEDFRPERFEEPLKHPLQYFAFGHGPRSCLGAHLAVMEMKSIIPRIILKYKIETCSSTPVELDAVTPNLLHWIINDRVNVRIVEISSL